MASAPKNRPKKARSSRSLFLSKTLDSRDLAGYEALQLLREALSRGVSPESSKYWAFPQKGGYNGGCRTGSAAAQTYLKFLRQHRSDIGGGILQHIVLDMIGRKRRHDDRDSFRAQIIGFFSQLDDVLHWAASKHLNSLDDKTFASLGVAIDRGLAITAADDEADMRERMRAAKSEAAREGWARRRSKQAGHAEAEAREVKRPTLRLVVNNAPVQS